MPTTLGWRTRTRVAGLLLTLILAACGGGGGGGGQPSDATPSANPDTVKLSGVLSMGENAAVDSDTNDPTQEGRSNNDDFPVAQALNTPVNLVGTVNVKDAGEEGPNRVLGDLFDVYKVSLKQGQVAELEFAADPNQNDLDLYIADSTGAIVGKSIGTGSTECLRVTTDGDYYVAVHANSGASLYNLRIDSPENARACVNATTAAHYVAAAGELVAQAKEDAPATSAVDASRARAQGLGAPGMPSATQRLQQEAGLTTQGRPLAAGPMLLRLPSGHAARLKGLARLAGLSDFKRASALSQAAAIAQSSPSPAHPLRDMADTVAYAKALKASGRYKYVSLNERFELSEAVPAARTFPPDDPEYPRQRWHYEQINLPAAMERLAGLATPPQYRPLVAVIDSGIVTDHPDLAPQIEEGYSFITLNQNGDSNNTNPDDPSVPDPDTGEAPAFHGSHVAGTIAASTFDGYGAAGIAPMARLMPLRVFDPRYTGAKLYDILYAMVYAAGLTDPKIEPSPTRKADVINMSLGSNMSCPDAYQQVINAVIQQGVIVVVAAGNSAHNDLGQSVPVGSPANCHGVVAVAALDGQRRQASYSQSGPGNQIRVSAPGGDVTAQTRDLVYSSVGVFTPAGRRVPSVGPSIGTSMATPHVAGIIALMKHVYPALTPAQFDAWLEHGDLTDELGGPGYHMATGYGLLNARKAVDRALNEAKTPGPAPQGKIVSTPSSLDFGAQRDTLDIELGISAATTDVLASALTGSRPALTVVKTKVDARTGLGTYTVKVDRAQLDAGTHFLEVSARTSSGTLSIPVTVIKPAGGNAGRRDADYGTVYVLGLDARTKEPVEGMALVVHAKDGQYTWAMQAPRNRDVYIVAGSDLDYNGFICDAGEPCGAYPILSNAMTPVSTNSNLGNLNFALIPMGTGNTGLQSLGKTGGTGTGPGSSSGTSVLGPVKLHKR